MLIASAIVIQPIINGRLEICMDLFLPNTSPSTPDKMDPIGLDTAPRLAAIIQYYLILPLECHSSYTFRTFVTC